MPAHRRLLKLHHIFVSILQTYADVRKGTLYQDRALQPNQIRDPRTKTALYQKAPIIEACTTIRLSVPV